MSEQTSPTRQCPACKSTVPAVVFCGACGADLGSPTDSWRVLLRPRTYAASPREPVFVPRLSSTLFPQIPARATRAYRIALVALLFCMAAMSALQWNVAVATISVLGVPMLFMLYAWEADVFQDARPQMVSALVLGTVIGLAWWWFSGYLLSHKYGVTTAAASAMENVIADEGLAVTLIGAALMILPLPLIRLIPARDADSLDGFVIGAGGALAHMTASYVIWWMPQIVAGLVSAQTTSGVRMFQDTITFGVIDPLTTIALGGMVGVSLWFRPDPAGPAPRRARAAVILCAVMTAALYAAVWGVDINEWNRGVELLINLGLTVVALLALRIGMQIALLHEERSPATGEPMLCVYCETIVPSMAFCPVCGAAARAASLTSRNLRRDHPPVPVSPVAG